MPISRQLEGRTCPYSSQGRGKADGPCSSRGAIKLVSSFYGSQFFMSLLFIFSLIRSFFIPCFPVLYPFPPSSTSIPSRSPASFQHSFIALIKCERSVLSPLITHFHALTFANACRGLPSGAESADTLCSSLASPLFTAILSFFLPRYLTSSHSLYLSFCLLCHPSCSTSH